MTTMQAKSRWGYHSVSYEEFLELKEAHKLLLRAYIDVKRYLRWSNKKECNRKGKEPIACKECIEYGYHRLNEKTFYGHGFLRYYNQNLYLHVLRLYQIARKPVATESEVVHIDIPRNLKTIIESLRVFYQDN